MKRKQVDYYFFTSELSGESCIQHGQIHLFKNYHSFELYKCIPFICINNNSLKYYSLQTYLKPCKYIQIETGFGNK